MITETGTCQSYDGTVEGAYLVEDDMLVTVFQWDDTNNEWRSKTTQIGGLTSEIVAKRLISEELNEFWS